MFRNAIVAFVFMFGSQQVLAEEWIYTFRPGDTLWDLCAKYIAAPNCWQKIATRNKVEKPKHIKPGTRLYLPITWLKVLPASAKVLSTRGDTKILPSDAKEAIALTKDHEVTVGDQIVTGDGTVTLQFADESILIITPGSEVSFDTLSLYGESGMVDTRVRLNRGRAKAKVKPANGPASRYEILTPAAVAAVRGTEFRVVSEATDPPQMRTEVLEGNVAVGNDEGEQDLPAGFALKAVSGEKPTEPIKLLSPPIYEADLPEEIRAFPWALKWHAVEGAQSYRVQIYQKGFLFDDLIQESETEATQYSVPKMEEGRYEVVVRAIDSQNFEGLEAKYTATVVDPRMVDKISISAVEEKQSDQTVIRWSWAALEGADKYKLHLYANTDEGGEQDRVVEVMDNHFEQGVIAPGEYRLKVAPVFASQTLAYSETESFYIRGENEAPLWLKILVGTIFAFVIL